MQTLTPEQFKKMYGTVNVQTKEQPTTFGQRFKGTLQQERQKIQDIRGSDASAPTKFLQQAATVTGLPLKAGYQALPEFARKGLSKAGEVVGKGIGAVSERISDIPAVQKFASGMSEGRFKKTSDVLSGISAAGETAGNVAVMYGAVKGGVAGAEKLGQGAKAVGQQISEFKAPHIKAAVEKYAHDLRKSNFRMTPVEKQKLGAKADKVVDYLKENKAGGTPEQQYQFMNSKYDAMEDSVQKLLKDSGKVYSQKEASQIVSKLPKQFAEQFDNPETYTDMVRRVQSLDKYIKTNFPNGLPADKFNAIKRNYMKQGFSKMGDVVVSESRYAIGEALYKQLLKDFPALKTLNNEYSTIVTGVKLLKKALTRNEVGMVGKLTGHAAGGAIGGAVGGPIGAGAGIMAGGQIAKVIGGSAARTRFARILEGVTRVKP